MSNPAYLWLTDENGSPVTGSCLMPTRLGSIELRSVSHHVWLPTDQHTGRLTGTRPMRLFCSRKNLIKQRHCYFGRFVKEERLNQPR